MQEVRIGHNVQASPFKYGCGSTDEPKCRVFAARIGRVYSVRVRDWGRTSLCIGVFKLDRKALVVNVDR